MPKEGRLRIPTSLITLIPFDRCPACEAERSQITKNSIVFACGLQQTVTEDDEFAISAYCPYAMAAVYELRLRKLARARPEQTPATLATFSIETFAVADRVQWISQSAGRETVKVGVVVAVVPPSARPEDYIPDGMRRNSTNGYGRSRTHTTYLVKVKGKGSMVYWPRVHCLEKYEQS
jgi:hypothetical protein